jgi:hypothetical protein
VTTEVGGVNGQALDGVRVTYEVETPSGQQKTIDLPIGAASGVGKHAVERGSGLKVTADRDYDEQSESSISAFDALQALRLAVGLKKSDGTAEWQDYIAADINGDGAVSAFDALNILKAAVGLTDGPQPEWAFVDSDADYAQIDRRSVEYDEGIALESVASEASLGLTGLLIGDVDGSYWA